MADVDAWMPLWIGAYLADTMHLSTEQHGAYLLLIMHHWRHGPLPDDDEELATIARLPLPAWKKMRPKIGAFFRVVDGIWTHKRVEQEKSDALGNRDRISAARSGAGKAGAEKRWAEKRARDGKPDGKPPPERMANTVANGWQTDGKADSKPIANGMANGWQTDGSTPLPPTTSLRSVADRAREPDAEPPSPSPAGEVCRALRVAGLSQVNPSHPKLLALLEAGAQPRMFVDMAKELLHRAPEKAGFGYVLAAVEGRMRDAATTIRALPAMTPEERAKAERKAAAVERISAENGGAKVEELGDGRFRCAARFYSPEGRRELAI